MECEKVDNDILKLMWTQFMIKLAPLAGKEITVNSYLDLFCRLCDDTVVQVRKTCATGMGDLANVIGTRLTEVILVSSAHLVFHGV